VKLYDIYKAKNALVKSKSTAFAVLFNLTWLFQQNRPNNVEVDRGIAREFGRKLL
jgi:hypothetical protein